MSKGLVYTGVDDERLPKGLKATWQRRAALTGKSIEEVARPFIDEHNHRWEIVGRCGRCGRDLVRGEDFPHLVNHLPSRLRPVARQLQQLTPEERAEVLALFDAGGRFLEAPDV